MSKRTAKGRGTQAGSVGESGLAQLVAPLVGGMTATREHLLEWVHAYGVVALDAVFRDEAEAVAGQPSTQLWLRA